MGTDERDWLIKHGLRSLVKGGHPGALDVVGFGPPKKINATLTIEPKQISVGESIELCAELNSSHSRAQNLMIDYVVTYVRKPGKTSQKVFKWKTLELPAGHSSTIRKRHSMKQTTVRALYAGVHEVEVQVNGERMSEADFKLLE